MKHTFKYILGVILVSGTFSACDGFLGLEPESNLSPAQYLTTEDNIAAYAIDLYNMLPVHGETSWGTWTSDAHTDNMAYSDPSDIFAPGYWKVGQTGGSYSFTEIYRCNYFFDNVLKQFEAGEITGVKNNINHYIGEVYFFRAWAYFMKLKALGDFPIIKTTLEDDLETLVKASVRQPRNEVARFILDDLDKAIELMLDSAPRGGRNRLCKDAARMLKSRVALYEGTWLKYFKGTAFVPGTADWPGKAAHPDYQFPAGDIDAEIDFFLTECMNESKIIADKYQLVDNTGVFQNAPDAAANPYFDMFGAADMSKYGEVIFWKAYSTSEGINNSVVEFASAANQGYGLTKSMVDAFVMKNGLPIYASGSGYPGDADLLKITEGRDPRAEIFIKKPGDCNLHSDPGPEAFAIEPWPYIVGATASMKYTTGYAIRKGLNFDGSQSSRNKSVVASIVFRATEAYLNYMEACYEKNGSLDADAQAYWTAIRGRSKLAGYQVTIDATDMDIEKLNDWGAYSAGQLVDETLFNIRRERRCELMAEGFRPDDVRRWRAMDQMITEPWHPLGANLWDQLATNQGFLDRNGALKEGENISPKTFSKYVAPYHILDNNKVYNGYTWKMAHYLNPIAVQHFLITGNGEVAESTLYQNPGWPTQAGMGAK